MMSNCWTLRRHFKAGDCGFFFVQVSFCFLQLAAQRDSIEPSVFFSIKKTVGSGS